MRFRYDPAIRLENMNNILMGYIDTTTHVFEEVPLYDFNAAVAAVGGNIIKC